MKFQIPIFLFMFSGWANAFEVSKGSTIADVAAAMKADGYQEGGGFTIDSNTKHDFRFWPVDQGTLIVGYSKATKKVLGLVYHLADEREHEVRKEFRFNVVSFDSTTGLLTLNTKKPAEQGADGDADEAP
jgi:hypothetical protein